MELREFKRITEGQFQIPYTIHHYSSTCLVTKFWLEILHPTMRKECSTRKYQVHQFYAGMSWASWMESFLEDYQASGTSKSQRGYVGRFGSVAPNGCLLVAKYYLLGALQTGFPHSLGFQLENGSATLSYTSVPVQYMCQIILNSRFWVSRPGVPLSPLTSTKQRPWNHKPSVLVWFWCLSGCLIFLHLKSSLLGRGSHIIPAFLSS